jgi:hypothetical protein
VHSDSLSPELLITCISIACRDRITEKTRFEICQEISKSNFAIKQQKETKNVSLDVIEWK